MKTIDKVNALFNLWDQGVESGYSIGNGAGVSPQLLGHYKKNGGIGKMSLEKAEKLADYYDKNHKGVQS